MKPEAIVDSPAFALPCRWGGEAAVLRKAERPCADMLGLKVALDGEEHFLGIARSATFAGLEGVWDARADVPEPVLLALVEKDCGDLLQLVENAVHRRLKISGLAEGEPPADRLLFLAAGDVVFALSRSAAVVSALGLLRNIDLADGDIRSQSVPAEIEYGAFAMPAADIASLEPGDAVLLPEAGSIPPRIIAFGRLAADAGGVNALEGDPLVHARGDVPGGVSLGALFDAAQGVAPAPSAPAPLARLRLVQSGATVAQGAFGNVGDQPAFIVESAGG